MNATLERRTITFVRTIADRCKSCLHRQPDRCRNCASQWANELMSDYENDAASSKPPPVDYSMATRKARILGILQSARRPLLAEEINLSDICSKGLKQWTLLRMLKSRQICREPNDDPADARRLYRYFIPNTKNAKGESTNDKRKEAGGRESGSRQET